MQFKSLTPVNDIDIQHYEAAISFALDDPSINNIALTGPYGAGKSSILRTYEAKHTNYKFLNISLASFKNDAKNEIDQVLIERSILQQLLYGEDANKLPYSRFKRITTPEYPVEKSLTFVLWAFVVAMIYLEREAILNFDYGWHLSWVSLLIGFGVACPIVLLADLYRASFRISLKKISLTNAEIETGERTENSILNRHLDEIIYFFQSTDKTIVVIEDLDRFGNTEIFVKLREINKLVNDNLKNKKQKTIKFLYALRDDMFVHKNRAKFFDFIIPVIPIINSSNSLDKMQELLKDCDLSKKIDPQFLREVSLYLDDLRLIHNIFNELNIYYAKLKSDSLDINKLFAMMVYKNVYPDDFERLHHGVGNFFSICTSKEKYLSNEQERLQREQCALINALNAAESECARSVEELMRIYISHIVMPHLGGHSIQGIWLSNSTITLSELSNLDHFSLIQQNKERIVLRTNHGGNVPTGKPFETFEKEINPERSFNQRKQDIENQSAIKQKTLREQLAQIEKELTELPTQPLYKLLQQEKFTLNFSEENHTNKSLLVYLVKNGYLNEHYHQYISNFHEGRLSKNDWEFLLTIRNFQQPASTQTIDNPAEVCANMRPEDFGQKYVLNVTLMQYLIQHRETCSTQIDLATRYITEHFSESQKFLAIYIYKGEQVKAFINRLANSWPELAIQTIASSEYELEIIACIVEHVSLGRIRVMNIDGKLTAYLSEHGAAIFASLPKQQERFDVLRELNVRFNHLSSIENNQDLLAFVHEYDLYAITPENVIIVLTHFGERQKLAKFSPEQANYTAIREAGSDKLKQYIHDNIVFYIEHVCLAIQGNINEDEHAIRELIHLTNDSELHQQLITKQEYIFKAFDELPTTIWTTLLQQRKVVISWENIANYLSYEGCQPEELTRLLNDTHVVQILTTEINQLHKLTDEHNEKLSDFIVNNDKIDDEFYDVIAQNLQRFYESFPEKLSIQKIKSLISAGVVELTRPSWEFAISHNSSTELASALISKNFEQYCSHKDQYSINDDIRVALLTSELGKNYKLTICQDMAEGSIKNNAELLKLFTSILLSSDVDYAAFNESTLTTAILIQPTIEDAIQLLIKCIPIWSDEKVIGVIANLPSPFNLLVTDEEFVEINNSIINHLFAKSIMERKLVYKVEKHAQQIRITPREQAS